MTVSGTMHFATIRCGDGQLCASMLIDIPIIYFVSRVPLTGIRPKLQGTCRKVCESHGSRERWKP
jgi:hypothetical protein